MWTWIKSFAGIMTKTSWNFDDKYKPDHDPTEGRRSNDGMW